MITYTFRLLAVSERSRSSEEIAEVIRQIISPMPEVINFSVLSQSGIGMGAMGGGNTIDIEIYGYDITQTNLAGRAACREGQEDPRRHKR